MNDVSIRQAVLSDLEVVASLFDGYRQFYGQARNLPAARDFLRARFEHGQSTVLLAEIDARPVGFTQLYPSFSSVSMARVYVLNDLYVSPSARRLGVGQALLQAALGYARTLGAVRLSLVTDVNNAMAQALYASMGWQRDTQFHAYHLGITS